MLAKQGPDGEHVVVYYSSPLSKTESNYCCICQELLAVVLSVHHFRPYLNFRETEGQVARWIEAHQWYDYSVQHWAGHLHNTDALLRHPCSFHCHRLEEWVAQRSLDERVSVVAVVVETLLELPEGEFQPAGSGHWLSASSQGRDVSPLPRGKSAGGAMGMPPGSVLCHA